MPSLKTVLQVHTILLHTYIYAPIWLMDIVLYLHCDIVWCPISAECPTVHPQKPSSLPKKRFYFQDPFLFCCVQCDLDSPLLLGQFKLRQHPLGEFGRGGQKEACRHLHQLYCHGRSRGALRQEVLEQRVAKKNKGSGTQKPRSRVIQKEKLFTIKI